MSWIIMIFPVIILIKSKSTHKKRKNRIKLIRIWIETEMKHLIRREKKAYRAEISSLIFIAFASINLLALLPFNFAPSSHMSINLIVSLRVWSASMINALKNSTENFLAHITPLGTPNALINFMVIIEVIRNIIRPITLAIRLCANIVAGHLLIRLLSNFSINYLNRILITSPTIIILVLLEIAVALIQAYVLSTLITLYYKDSF